ncbi:GNAT family N-acetyltransferase [Mammaliicoccus sp. Dog046]|uniref:GNAT family N-acetyltransferase n=1 Tax=Mammaliicoccus sp. Dog046 TaxID=3034233 RepID=UPI002B259A6C|nr:GNAT family N-acetyltransferase [Mammaliicoccus sp. Dog046]WQK85705.1 GNAT family N-acetyltransferase [Mammaliicoccus sp. Dog046]
MIIRDKRDEDIESLAKIHYESWLTTYKGIILESYLSKLTLESYIEKHQIFNAPCIVAEVDGQVVGFLMYKEDHDIKCGEIMVIYLLKAFQNKGIGTQLMLEVESRLKLENDQLSLWVIEDNIPSVKFYEKLGYRKDGEYEFADYGNVLRETRMIKKL